MSTVVRDRAPELADVLNVFARTGRLPAPDPQPPASDEFWRDAEARQLHGRRAGFYANG